MSCWGRFPRLDAITVEVLHDGSGTLVVVAVEIPHHPTGFKLGRLPVGCWDWTVHGGWSGEPARSVPAIRCPVCERLFSLANHAIATSGAVSPSVVCPRSCTFHVTVRLLSW